jgi:hypothetical protein
VFNSSNSAGCFLRALPSGKRLVIQEFDADLLVGTGVKPANLLLNGTVYSHYFPAILMGNYNGDQYAAHQATHLYTNVAATPQCFATLSDFTTGSITCNISGFLIDAQ